MIKYTDLTLTEKETSDLKALISTDPEFKVYHDLWVKTDFETAVESLLNGIPNIFEDITY